MTDNDPLTADSFGDLSHRGWLAFESIDRGAWKFRAAEGVSKRANSVLVRGDIDDVDQVIADAEEFYRERGLQPTFQTIENEPAPHALASLQRAGYRPSDETLVLVADPDTLVREIDRTGSGSTPVMTVDDYPDEMWLTAWAIVGEHRNETELQIARRLVENSPALYAAARDTHGRALSIGRLALVGRWAGIYALGTMPEERGQGYARAVIRALVADGRERGIEGVWLQVLSSNDSAFRIYERLGFSLETRYEYWRRPTDAAETPEIG